MELPSKSCIFCGAVGQSRQRARGFEGRQSFCSVPSHEFELPLKYCVVCGVVGQSRQKAGRYEGRQKFRKAFSYRLELPMKSCMTCEGYKTEVWDAGSVCDVQVRMTDTKVLQMCIKTLAMNAELETGCADLSRKTSAASWPHGREDTGQGGEQSAVKGNTAQHTSDAAEERAQGA